MTYQEFVHVALKTDWPNVKVSLIDYRERPYKPSFAWDRASNFLQEHEEEDIRRSYRKEVLDLWHRKDKRDFYNFMNRIMRVNLGLPSTVSWNSETAWSRESSSDLAVDFWSNVFSSGDVRLRMGNHEYWRAQ